MIRRLSLSLFLFLCCTPFVHAQPITTTACPGAGCITFNVSGKGSVGIQITGTWVGTITFQASVDNTNFTAINVIPAASPVAVSTTIANGVWSASVGGITAIRVVFTDFSSGPAIVSLNTAQAKASSGTGTVTNIATTSPITGSATTTGTIGCPTCGVTGTGLQQFAATTSAQLAGVLSDETGSNSGGLAVFNQSPTIITPTIANFTNATHDHQAAAGGGTLAEAALVLTDLTTNNVSATAHGFVPKFPNNTTTFLRGDGTYTTPISIATTSPITGGTITGTGTLACATCGVTGTGLQQFAATSSAQLAGVLSDETGSGGGGLVVFSQSPAIVTPTIASFVNAPHDHSNAANGGTINFFAWGGDGSDNALVYDGTTTILGMAPVLGVYTLTRDIFATNLTVNLNDGSGHTVTILTNNFAIYATGTLSNAGSINNNGATGSAGVDVTTSSAGGGGGGTKNAPGLTTARYGRLQTSVAGTAGANGSTTTGSQAAAANAGNNVGAAIDSSGSTGSTGAAGGKGGDGVSGSGGALRAGGGGGTVAVAGTSGRSATSATTGFFVNPVTQANTQFQTQNGGDGGAPGGSGGGGDTTNPGAGGGGGGGEGGGGGIVAIFAATITNTGTISSLGATGGKGGNGGTMTTGNVGGGGGGGAGAGGKGGIVWLIYHTLTNSGTISAAGGSAGAVGSKGSPHGTGTDNAAAGASGPSGPAGLVIQIAA